MKTVDLYSIYVLLGGKMNNTKIYTCMYSFNGRMNTVVYAYMQSLVGMITLPIYVIYVLFE